MIPVLSRPTACFEAIRRGVAAHKSACLITFFSSLTLWAFGIQPASAAVFENLGVSATANSLGNAVVASPPGIVESIHYNPSGLARLDGNRASYSLELLQVRGRATFSQPEGYSLGGYTRDPLAGTASGPVRNAVFIPGGYGLNRGPLSFALGGSMGWSWNKPGSPWTFATAVYPVAGFGYDRRTDPNDPARFAGNAVMLQRFAYFAPSVAYKVSDTLRVGLALPVSHNAVAAELPLRTPNVLLGLLGKAQGALCPASPTNEPLLGLCSGGEQARISPYQTLASVTAEATQAAGLDYTIGATWDAAPWLSLGASYRGGVKAKLKGSYVLRTGESVRALFAGLAANPNGALVGDLVGLPKVLPEIERGPLSVELPVPWQLQLGLTWRPASTLQFNLDALRGNWQSWPGISVDLGRTLPIVRLLNLLGVEGGQRLDFSQGFENVWHFGYGMEWEFRPGMRLRLGYEARKSSIAPDKLSLLLPLSDFRIRSVGGSWQFAPDQQLEFGLSIGKTSFNAPANTSCALNCNTIRNILYNPYAGLDVTSDLSALIFGMTYSKRF